jgi:hypothetical protein
LQEAGKAAHHADREQAAENYRARREDSGTTQRRIEKLEALERQAQRRLDGTDPHWNPGQPATGEYREYLLRNQARYREQLGYRRAHVAALKAERQKAYGRDCQFALDLARREPADLRLATSGASGPKAPRQIR